MKKTENKKDSRCGEVSALPKPIPGVLFWASQNHSLQVLPVFLLPYPRMLRKPMPDKAGDYRQCLVKVAIVIDH